MNEQSKVTRRHVLMGGAALAALALVPAAIDDAPRAEAIPPRRRKYFYSANPISNKHRYGWLELPHLTHSSTTGRIPRGPFCRFRRNFLRPNKLA